MYADLKGKRLLYVGSDAINRYAIETAHEMGIYVIVVDGITDRKKSPGKLIADEAWDIDYSDIDAIVEKCKGTKIDGVLAGYSEFRALAACKIANRLGLPFYATEEQIELTRNKRVFKDICQKYGIHVPKDYCFSYPVPQEDKDKIKFPVIVKPADNAGRKGISVCYDSGTLDEAIEYAASKSESKTIIIEDYIEGVEISAIYTIVDGQISLSCLNEKYITDDQERQTGLCDFILTPAFFLPQFKEEADKPIKDFLKGISANNGIVFFQGKYTDHGIYIFEMGYRLNGNNDYYTIEKYHGLSYLKMLIHHSLTGSMGDDLSKDSPEFDRYTGTLTINAHQGEIGKVDYSGLYANPNIDYISCRVECGTQIVEDGSTQQKVLTLKFTADSIDEVKELIKYAQDNVIIENVEGKNMLFKPFDVNRLGR